MKNLHHICFERHDRVIRLLRDVGFDVELPIVVDIFEEDERWPLVNRLASKYPIVLHTCVSKFTDEELFEASRLNIFCHWHQGYPQPESPLLAYMAGTYDLSNFCTECATGAVQVAPFHIRKAPNWGSRHVMMLNWVQDAYFVRPDVWRSVFEPFGINYWPVLEYKSDKELSSIVQLRIDQYLPCGITLSDARVEFEVCPLCHRKRFGVDGCGKFPLTCTAQQQMPLAYSQEYFGVGQQSYHETFISHDLYLAIQKHKLKGLTFTPIEEAVSEFRGQTTK